MPKRIRKNSLVEGGPPDPVLAVGSGVTPHPKRLVSVSQFIQTVKYIREVNKSRYDESFIKEALENELFDFENLVYIPPSKRIAKAIERVVEDQAFDNLSVNELIEAAKIPKEKDLKEIEDNSNLESIKRLKLIKKIAPNLRKKEVNYAVPYKRKFNDNLIDKNNNLDNNGLDGKNNNGNKNDNNFCLDVILDIIFYHPKTHCKAQEFLVLSSQYLHELRDKIHCSKDSIVPPDHPGKKSNFFFIEDTFYSDLRKKHDVIDQGAIIAQWIGSKESYYWCTRNVQLDRMEKTKFEQLKICIGKMYLYCHHGNCEHQFLIKNISMIGPQGPIDKGLYPILIFQHKIKQVTCQICEKYPSKIVTINDSFALQEPFHYCERCYKLAHYDKNNQSLAISHIIIT